MNAATPARIDPLSGAYYKFILAIQAARPRPLAVDASPGALQDRACHLDAQFIAFVDWAEAMIEDTAGHCHLARREADYVKGAIMDLASDLRGRLNKEVEDRAA